MRSERPRRMPQMSLKASSIALNIRRTMKMSERAPNTPP
jgi:hypothetical protein